MAQIKFFVTLAVEGKHPGLVGSDSPAAVPEGLNRARVTYQKLLDGPGGWAAE